MTNDNVASVLAWFERYDAMVAARDIQAMADQAVFPLNEVTDDGKGEGSAEQTSRAEFVAQMEQQLSADVTFDVTRTPHFLSDALVFVVTDGTMTYQGHSQPIRYGDLLLKSGGEWKFQTMVQGGWGAGT